ncbi:GNAT family N-acetyltransferase [Alkaliphilus hydrothermalis]|uniref:GNAT superfamily N-acetyltransferase n=1 Tax=Alkaliphilus hydrothermalis TaxID=1482730 RepID=A0ABS2NMJ7_9FIRM|nr:GNAT family N-acetyltransferase [Alkaliphilus hydrothermalis]MBM7614057.1 GNAT superfamily N-acetyltransferase [Alkaliphilus hydrothermalis]
MKSTNNKINQEKTLETIEILHRDEIRNINLINFMKQYPITTIGTVGDSILVKGKSDENWIYISSENEEEFKGLLSSLNPDDQYFAIMEDWMLAILTKDRDVEWTLSCMKLYFPEDKPLPALRLKAEALKPHEAEYIFNHYDYKQFTSVEYIVERINKGVALGIYEGEQLVAWVITHDDGAIGFLTVLPEYRRKGYGYDLTIAAIEKLRQLGEVAFVHIEEENIRSISLAEKTGFVKDRMIHWTKLTAK